MSKLKEQTPITLRPEDVDFFKYFIKSYHKNFKKARFDDAHHDAVTILLELERIFERPHVH